MFFCVFYNTFYISFQAISNYTHIPIDFFISLCYTESMNTNEINPTTNPQIPEAYKTLKHKPFRFGDYYFLQEPTPALQQLLNQPTGGFAELISHIFNRTHQSRYTVFPTIYKQLTDFLAFADKETEYEISYTINLLFRESKLAGFQYSKDLTSTPNGFYFMNYYNARIAIKPITGVYAIRREHLVSLIDLLDEYNHSGFVIRTSFTKQPIKKV